MSNGVRRTQAAGLKASAGSNVSKRYKRLAYKLGVKHKTPGALIQASRKHKSVKRKITKHSMDYVKPMQSVAKAGLNAGAAAGAAVRALQKPSNVRSIQSTVGRINAQAMDRKNGTTPKAPPGATKPRQIGPQDMQKFRDAIGKMGGKFGGIKRVPKKPRRPGLGGIKLPKLPGKFGQIQDAIKNAPKPDSRYRYMKRVKHKSPSFPGAFRGMHGGVDDDRGSGRATRSMALRAAKGIYRFNRGAVGRKK